MIGISIHAPHTGRDVYLQLLEQGLEISIHAPHTGRDPLTMAIVSDCVGFQSTRPIRGATMPPQSHPGTQKISIHAPHTGRDGLGQIRACKIKIFQSTRPIRGATNTRLQKLDNSIISIHAPHTGRDFCKDLSGIIGFDFNPRAPYGARLLVCLMRYKH